MAEEGRNRLSQNDFGDGLKAFALSPVPESTLPECSTEGRTRTDTSLRTMDFESIASAISPLRPEGPWQRVAWGPKGSFACFPFGHRGFPC